MNRVHGLTWGGLVIACVSATAWGQADPSDFRIRAKLRVPDEAAWAAGESVGNADFRIHSRFMQVYYGGVMRNDDYRFSVDVDFTDVSDYLTEFPVSPYNTDMDIYIEDAFVGRLDMNNPSLGFGELSYDSRHAELPDLPLPSNFPSPVEVHDVVRLYTAAGAVPAIGSPRPSGTPLFQGELIEMFARGDVNQDNEVDEEDFAFLAGNYDPHHLAGTHLGPTLGDFTGDSRADLADYQTMAANWTGNDPIPGEPAPTVTPCDAIDLNHDQGVTIDDLILFLTAFEAGSMLADIDDGSSTNTHDGGVTIDDLIYFLTRFEAGC